MSTYYIDTENGKDTNNGESATTPAVSLNKIDVKPGDTVLFKRGTYIRGKLNNICGTEGKPITYGAYGEGKKPIFSGSLDVSCRSMWKEEKKNVWVCSEIADEAGNFVFDNGEKFGTLKWSQEELTEQGDFYDNCFGYSTAGKNIGANHKIYLYSKINPGEYYRHIECAVYGERSLADTGHDMIFDELKFVNSGVHAIAGEGKSRNITVRNCSFENIGGCVWDKENKIRFGNGVNAPYGAAIYSIIDKAAEKQVHISDNIYYTENGELLNYFGEKSYRKFEEYGVTEKLSQYICFAGYKEIKEVCCHGQSF